MSTRLPLIVVCKPCGHFWIGMYTPMPMADAARVMHNLTCPMCAADSSKIQASSSTTIQDVVKTMVDTSLQIKEKWIGYRLIELGWTPPAAAKDDPLKAVRWVCPSCTTVNAIAELICVGCRKTPRPPQTGEH